MGPYVTIFNEQHLITDVE